MAGEGLVALRELLQEVADASMGDSNDREIEALQDALDVALNLLGVEMPEPREEED